ncbi:MAG: hypothetical protein OXG55_11575 [bacterium]|nr:hypothetical protein [bacterium]
MPPAPASRHAADAVRFADAIERALDRWNLHADTPTEQMGIPHPPDAHPTSSP